jgi:hypothetical protein
MAKRGLIVEAASYRGAATTASGDAGDRIIHTIGAIVSVSEIPIADGNRMFGSLLPSGRI